MRKNTFMIDKTFEKYKYRRTYIGGSKKDEMRTFTKVQGRADDNSQCDWFEYRRILSQYYDDVLNVLFSWKNLTENISNVILIVGILFLHTDAIFYSLIATSIIVRIISYKLGLKVENILKNYEMCLSVTLNEIKKLTGLELSK
jgi:hypothetical protein